MIWHKCTTAMSTAQVPVLCERPAAIHQSMMLQVTELQQNYSDWLSQQAGEQDAAHEMHRAVREAQGDSQALRHKLSAAQQQHSRAEAKYHSKVGQPARVVLSGRASHRRVGAVAMYTAGQASMVSARGSAALTVAIH